METEAGDVDCNCMDSARSRHQRTRTVHIHALSDKVYKARCGHFGRNKICFSNFRF